MITCVILHYIAISIIDLLSKTCRICRNDLRNLSYIANPDPAYTKFGIYDMILPVPCGVVYAGYYMYLLTLPVLLPFFQLQLLGLNTFVKTVMERDMNLVTTLEESVTTLFATVHTMKRDE